AFNNLVDPAEEDFLRENLPPGVFRNVQRARLRAAIEYVMCAAKNAAVLIRVGKAASAEPDPELSRQAENLVTAAIQLRLFSFLVLSILWVKIAFPSLRLSLTELSG